MAGEHDVVVSGAAVSSNVLSHFNHCMHMAGMHQDHGRHGHLSPSHHGHKHHRRNGLLHHAALVWQTGRSHDVTKITPGFDSSASDPDDDYPTRFSSAALNSLKRNLYPLAPSFSG